MAPNQEYQVKLDVELASNAPNNGIGIGGAPGEGVIMKCGLVAAEPVKILGADQVHYRLNLDKGNQGLEGKDLINMGNIANGLNRYEYKLISRTANFKGKTNAQGEAWVVLGTDSGFEGTTTVYYTSVNITLHL